jgi:hypothetical protein
MDDGCIADLVREWCDPAAAAAIVADLGWVEQTPQRCSRVMAREGGDTTTRGEGGGIKGRIIIRVVLDVYVDVELMTLTLMSMSTLTSMAVELKAAEPRTAVGSAGQQCGCSCWGERVAESVPIRGRVIQKKLT